jgi:hypothetical protein
MSRRRNNTKRPRIRMINKSKSNHSNKYAEEARRRRRILKCTADMKRNKN